METSEINMQYEDDFICPYCGHIMTQIDGLLYCENCGTREI